MAPLSTPPLVVALAFSTKAAPLDPQKKKYIYYILNKMQYRCIFRIVINVKRTSST